MDFSRMKQLVVPEGVVKKIETGGKTVWQSVTDDPLTAAQISAINAGTFENINVGYYWTFIDIPYTYVDENNVIQSDTYSRTMRVADCNYYLNTGDTPLTTHHVVVVPDANMFKAQMNASATTTGGYVGSKMRTTYLRRAEALFKACFGKSHILKHREYLVNAVSNGKESAGVWYDSTVELMNERMVFETAAYANTSLPRVSSRQLTLFKNNIALKAIEYWYWLRNVFTSTGFVGVYYDGICFHFGNLDASRSYGVHPAALI